MWNAIDDSDKKVLESIEYSKSLYDAQKKKVEQEKYIEKLLFIDYVDRIKANKSRYDYVNIFHEAQSEVGKKLKKERTHLETIKSFIMEDFLNNDNNFKLTEIVSGGWEGYYWLIHFEGYGKTVYIQIPIMNNIHIGNFEYANCGKFAFGIKEKENYWNTLESSYKIEDIAKFIREYFGLDKAKEESNG